MSCILHVAFESSLVYFILKKKKDILTLQIDFTPTCGLRNIERDPELKLLPPSMCGVVWLALHD